MSKSKLILFLLFLLSEQAVFGLSNLNDLKSQINQHLKKYKAHIGVSLILIETGDSFSINNSKPFTMQSVYKFPLAIAVLKRVDLGEIKLSDKIQISEKKLDKETWSPMLKKYKGDFELSIADLLYYSVSLSDNNACDQLFKLMNGPAKVQKSMIALGIKDISILNTEDQMHKDEKAQYRNNCQIMQASSMLENFFRGKYLSKENTAFLLKLMTESENSSNRIKGQLPEGTIVAHKTGTSGTNKAGVQAACNDIGIITLPNGTHLALSVFVSNSRENYEDNERIISGIAKLAYDFFTPLLTNKELLITHKIDSLLNLHPEFNGVINIANYNHTIYKRALGFSSLEKKIPLRNSDQFVVGSVTKQFTAVLILQAYEKGLLSLDKPIKLYLPNLKQAWADTVTIHHLLSHTHGIQDFDKPTAFAVGTKYDYSQIGFEIMAMILEKTSGMAFPVLADSLFKKCGMMKTFHPSLKKYNKIPSYTKNEKGELVLENRIVEFYPPAGGFISTSEDLIIWNQLLFGGLLLNPETYKLMITPKEKAIRDHSLFGKTLYGYGLTINQPNQLSQLGQTGFAPGFASMNFYFPDSGISLIILENIIYNESELKKSFNVHLAILEIVKTTMTQN